MEKVVFADVAIPESEPFYVAYDKGYFREEGLEVVRLTRKAGRDAAKEVINGTADLAVAADTIAMRAGLSGAPIYVLATIAENDRFVKIVARKDRGIASPADLAGKKIGVSRGTNGEFFLHAFLGGCDIPAGKVAIIDLNPDKIAPALERGEIDAAATWEPNISAAVKALGVNAVTFEDRDFYLMTWNLLAHRDYVKSRTETVKKVLRALIRADELVDNNPAEGKAILGKYVQGISADMGHQVHIKLSQELILNLEDQARWAVRNGKGKTVPNYLEYIYPGPLRELRPETVTID